MVGSWFGLRWLHDQGVKELALTRKFGDVVFIPDGFQSDGWLRYHWKKITLRFEGGEVQIHKPELVIRLATSAPYGEHLRLQMDSLSIRIDPNATKHEKKKIDTNSWQFPKVNLPIRVLALIPKVRVDVKDIGSWTVNDAILRNSGTRKVELEFAQGKGTYLIAPVHAQMNLSWSDLLVEADARMGTGLDSIWLEAQAPMEHIDEISGEWRIHSTDPLRWSPKALPAQIPTVKNIDIKGQYSSKLSTPSLKWDAQASFDLGSYWQIPVGRLSLNGHGDLQGNANATLRWLGSSGEVLDLSAMIDSERRLTLNGSVKDLYLDLGHQHMLVDAQIKNATWHGDSATVELQTVTGSLFKANITHLADPIVTLHADVASDEPWAIAWCDSHLHIQSPATIDGTYTQGIFEADVKAVVPFAYRAMADEMTTHLSLSSSGITFNSGTILTRGVMHTFDGEVIWDPSDEHFQFEVKQDTGKVWVFGDFGDHVSLELAQVPLHSLPLADTSLLRGYDAKASGTWKQNFKDRQGSLNLSLATEYKGLPISVDVSARQNLDSLILDSLDAETANNHLTGSMLALIDSATESPVLQHVNVHTNGFSLPAILKAFGDSTFTSAKLQGDFSWDRKAKLDGKLSIQDIAFRSVPQDEVRVQRLQIIGEGDQLQASARVHLGRDGLWDSEIAVHLKRIFDAERSLDAALVTDNGGIFWLEGTLDSNKVWKGNAHVEGPWYLPGQSGEIRDSKMNAQITADLKKGLAGIDAQFVLDTARFVSPTITVPLRAQGNLGESMLSLDSIFVYGSDSTSVQGMFSFDLAHNKINDLRFASKELHLRFQKIHNILIHDLKATTTISSQELRISVLLPKMEYKVDDASIGKISSRANANIAVHIPLHTDSLHAKQSTRIDGRVELERFIYDKQFAVVWDQLGALYDRFNKTIKDFGHESGSMERANTQVAHQRRSPDLDIHVVDPGKDSLIVRTNVARFPFTLDVLLQGTTEKPILTGDVNSVGKGFIGLEGFSTLDLQTMRITWQDNVPKKGNLEVSASKDVPFCEQVKDGLAQTCTVNFSVNSPLLQPNPIPTANCGTDPSPALIYRSIFLLGCFSTSQTGAFDINGAASKVLNTVVSKGINKGLGQDYIGDMGLKWRFISDPTSATATSVDHQDSNYIRVPIKLDRWVKNLSFVVGYSQDLSTNPRYDQAYEVGLNYSMPVLDSGEHLVNHIDPTLDFGGNLVARRYLNANQQGTLEKNLGIHYSWSFWDYCLFDRGDCQEVKP